MDATRKFPFGSPILSRIARSARLELRRLVTPERLFTDRERALIEPLSLAVPALVPVQGCQVVEGLRHVGVVAPERLFADRERALVEPLSLAVPALRLVHAGQVVEGLRHVGVVAPERL